MYWDCKFILRSFCLALLYLQRFVLKVSDVSACTGLTWGRMFADMYYKYRPHVVIGPGKYVCNIISKFIYSIDLPRIASIAVVVIIIIFLNVIVIVVIIIIIIIIITTNLFLFTTLLCRLLPVQRRYKHHYGADSFIWILIW